MFLLGQEKKTPPEKGRKEERKSLFSLEELNRLTSLRRKGGKRGKSKKHRYMAEPALSYVGGKKGKSAVGSNLKTFQGVVLPLSSTKGGERREGGEAISPISMQIRVP